MSFWIGMFPYVMIATTPIFCGVDWPKKLPRYLPVCVNRLLPSHEEPQTSEVCLYPKYMIKSEDVSTWFLIHISLNIHITILATNISILANVINIISVSIPLFQKSKQSRSADPPLTLKEKPSKKHHITALLTVMYLLLQCFLPYSHFITQVPFTSTLYQETKPPS